MNSINIKQVENLLNRLGKKTLVEHNSLKEEVPPYENYYQLQSNDTKWVYGLFMRERENSPYIKTKKEFNTEEEGAKYFFLDRLSFHYFSEHIKKFMMKYDELDIGGDTINENALLKAMSLLTIPASLYARDKTQVKNRAILLEMIDDDQSIVSFLNNRGEVVHSTIPMNNQRALFIAFKKIYLLYLFEQKVSPLLETYHLRDEFTDQDINLFIS